MREEHGNYKLAELIAVWLVPIRNFSNPIRWLLQCKNIRQNLFTHVTVCNNKQTKAISKGITIDSIQFTKTGSLTSSSLVPRIENVVTFRKMAYINQILYLTLDFGSGVSVART